MMMNPETTAEAMLTPTEPTAGIAAAGFASLGLSPLTLQAIEQAGYSQPTPIQAQTIPHALAKSDILGLSQTGSGKTASFLIPILERLSSFKRRARMPSVLVLEPTRELAAQVIEAINVLGKPFDVTSCLIIGGTQDQSRALQQSVDIVVATPGRLMDLLQRGGLILSGIQVFVLDEADRMLDMGFIPDVETIEASLPKTRQTMFYSATMPAEIERLTKQFLRDPVTIRITPKVTTAATITQKFYGVTTPQKTALLIQLLQDHALESAIVFCNRKRDIPAVCRALNSKGYRAEALHGDMTQEHRTKTLTAFKAGEVKLLIASDVAARGLDVDDLPAVVNFDVPKSPDDYVHRIGRTGRAGKSGVSITLVTEADDKLIKALRQHLKQEVLIEPTASAPASQTPAHHSTQRSAEATNDQPATPRGRLRSGGRNRPATTQDAPTEQTTPKPRQQQPERPIDNRADKRVAATNPPARQTTPPPSPNAALTIHDDGDLPSFLKPRSKAAPL
jgi:superfamily II DNA/RNA helicase